jgi:hypothetical protein
MPFAKKVSRVLKVIDDLRLRVDLKPVEKSQNPTLQRFKP